MTNQEIADLFTELIPDGDPKDLYDRFLDIAIYINETTKEGEDISIVINSMASCLNLAYTLERI